MKDTLLESVERKILTKKVMKKVYKILDMSTLMISKLGMEYEKKRK